MPTTVGVMVFLLFLLLAVQVVYNLYATSAVTAAAYDGARMASGADGAGDPSAHARAESHVRGILGRYGRERVSFEWIDDPTDTVLTVRATNPSFLPLLLRAPLGLDEVERTVRVRTEREEPA